MTFRTMLLLGAAASALTGVAAQAEQTALVLFETKGMTTEPRREGMAIVDIDPASPDFGEVLAEYPLPPGTVGHHIFYSPDRGRAYVTSLGSPVLHVFDMTAQPYRRTEVPVPDCIVGEDVAFSPATGRWFLTCMGSSKVVVGDLESDEVLEVWDLPEPWPHGITVREDLGRVLVTSTANPAVMGEYGDSVTELDLATGEVIAVHSTRVAGAEAPSGPVEIFFVPHAEPPVAYVTNIPQGDLWIAEWDPESESFAFRQGFDFAALGQGMALEVYFDEEAEKAYVTTASPGHVNAFDISDPRNPRHLGAVATAPGAHHMAFSADGALAFVQNGLMNIDGINDGSITVVDLASLEAVDSIDTFKEAGFTVNMIEGMPDEPRAHAH